jgi:poly(3-hydroxybutyrate) depolymerase
MRNLSDTISRLAAFRRLASAKKTSNIVDRLGGLTEFGSNPGALRARTYLPAGLQDNAPLVVVLHGCAQTAAAYDYGSGWSPLADQQGIALLFPEQAHANNPNLCFNWFLRDDTRRDSGEALSIRQMIEAIAAQHSIDRRRDGVGNVGGLSRRLCRRRDPRRPALRMRKQCSGSFRSHAGARRPERANAAVVDFRRFGA